MSFGEDLYHDLNVAENRKNWHIGTIVGATIWLLICIGNGIQAWENGFWFRSILLFVLGPFSIYNIVVFLARFVKFKKLDGFTFTWGLILFCLVLWINISIS